MPNCLTIQNFSITKQIQICYSAPNKGNVIVKKAFTNESKLNYYFQNL